MSPARAARSALHTILVPVDFSAVTRAVVAEAATLAKLRRDRIVLVHVVQPPILLPEFGGMLETVVPMVNQTEKAAARLLVRWKQDLRRRGLAVAAVQLDGHPATEILREARARNPALIVIGSHGHTAFYDLFVGSTTGGVLKKAPCPVVVVPAHGTGERPAPR